MADAPRAIVTGASRGLGAAIAKRFAADGVRVALTARTLEPDDRQPGSLSEVVAEIEAAGGEAIAIAADLSSPEDRARIVAEANDRLGGVDILVNNAAVTFMYPFAEFPEKRWRLMFEVQCRAPFELAQLVVPQMIERRQGWILNITSRAAVHPVGPPFPDVHVGAWSAYGMVKAALDRFSTALAAELSPHGVAVNALAPWDNVATPGAGAHELVDGFALEGPEWVAEAAYVLCTSDPVAMTGRVAYSQPFLAELSFARSSPRSVVPSQPDALIIDGVRTPRGRGRDTGALHHLHPQDLLGQCLRALEERNGIDSTDVDDVIMGNGNSVGDHNADIARLAVLDCGWSIEAPGLTINRFCGSGQQAVSLAAMGIRAGYQDLMVAGGVESMSRWPKDQTPLLIDGDNPHLREVYPMVPQGISADAIATMDGFTRGDVDALAVSSQDRAAKAIAEGRFDRSVITVRNPDGTVALDEEEHPRPGTTVESLAKLSASFEALGTQVLPGMERPFDDMVRDLYPQISRVEHVHTAGNSSGVVDGAAAVLLASPGYAAAHGLTPRAKVVMAATAGAEPVIMLTAPAPASRLCLDKAGMSVADIDLWEINEAFASVVLRAIRELDLDPDKVNVNGGAMALGHPIGATGAMLIQTALDELERQDKTTALITMCTGGGMGTATIIERV